MYQRGRGAGGCGFISPVPGVPKPSRVLGFFMSVMGRLVVTNLSLLVTTNLMFLSRC